MILAQRLDLGVGDIDVNEVVEELGNVAHRQDDVALEEEAAADDEGAQAARRRVEQQPLDAAQLRVWLDPPDIAALADVDRVQGPVQLFDQPGGARTGDQAGEALSPVYDVRDVELVRRQVVRRLERLLRVLRRVFERRRRERELDPLVRGSVHCGYRHDAVVVEAEAALPEVVAGAQEADVDDDMGN